jgi:uncharacterized protein YdhG (YjbR/CyaY superfamily)
MKHKSRTTAKARIKIKVRSKAKLDAVIKSKASAKTTANPSAKPETIDEYFAALGDDQRAALERLRRSIKAVAPAAVECISYQLPAFRLDGRLLVAFGAWANHCAFYPGAVMDDLKAELKGYDISKGTIRFPSTRPLPIALVRKLVKARIAKTAFQQRHAEGRAARRQ